MRRKSNQDKYIKFILCHRLLNNSQKIWLVYWFLDQQGYPRCFATTERELGMSLGSTGKRIIKDLLHLNILKRIGGKQLGINRKTPIFDFTADFEMQVAEFCSDTKGYWLDEEYTRPFDEISRQNVQQIPPGDLNNKGTSKQIIQSKNEFSPLDYQQKYPEVNRTLIILGTEEGAVSFDSKLKIFITR